MTHLISYFNNYIKNTVSHTTQYRIYPHGSHTSFVFNIKITISQEKFTPIPMFYNIVINCRVF